MISNETVTSYLERLASKAPTPGGGAAAALHAAQGAALVSMVAEFTSGPRYAEVQEQAQLIAKQAKMLMREALIAAQEDERLFGKLGAAYGMPKGTEEQKAVRRLAIGEATVDAAGPLVLTVRIAASVVELAQELLPIGNRSVSSDVAAAAEAARAALATALVTLEMNIAAIKDVAERERLRRVTEQASEAISQAEQLSAAVRLAVTV
ncbi:cyclodeaminase/cyclohydrolase family protein [Glutamicibacter sp. AOP5-A2-18]|uniref:cyclodeaminase/cyclohydrolase family protein n=1 Tax=Glutamicibacter sp. AOP5-A2-18 TaxID=3457656 RepID=UPI004033596C